MSNFNHYPSRKFVFLLNNFFPMKHTLIFILLSTSLSFISCKNTTTHKVITVESTEEQESESVPMEEQAFAKLTIEGMTCAIGCAATIEKNLQKTTGVASATVDFESKTAWVIYDEKYLTIDAITTVVKNTGEPYRVSETERLKSFD